MGDKENSDLFFECHRFREPLEISPSSITYRIKGTFIINLRILKSGLKSRKFTWKCVKTFEVSMKTIITMPNSLTLRSYCKVVGAPVYRKSSSTISCHVFLKGYHNHNYGITNATLSKTQNMMQHWRFSILTVLFSTQSILLVPELVSFHDWLFHYPEQVSRLRTTPTKFARSLDFDRGQISCGTPEKLRD